MEINNAEIRRVIASALQEDIGKGDLTSQLTVASSVQAEMAYIAREAMTVCGMVVLEPLFLQLDAAVRVQIMMSDGAQVQAGETLATVQGPARAILTGERVSLNLMQHLSGIATQTRAFVDAVAHTQAQILDTRKTLPGLRWLQKYAVVCGGAVNHRMRLDDGILIKDNHLVLGGGVRACVRNAHNGAPRGMPVQVECDTLEQVQEALEAGADGLLLDNMSLVQLQEAVQLAQGKAWLEASGGVALETVRAIAETGVNRISVGALTHSVRGMDIGLDWIKQA